MRVISGKSRGTVLSEIRTNNIRPTIDRAKEAIFSSIHFLLNDAKVLDLFAGTGQLGIEALSRGANSCVFVDIDKISISTITKNIYKTNFQDISFVVNQSYDLFLSSYKGIFDIIFLDPPYKSGMIESSFNFMENILSKNSIIICEHSSIEVLPESFYSFSIYKIYKYGNISFTVYKYN
ncbi:MAG: 16S rRNA (guanine(966)-N(2))-methyltransferase RsmD [Oscillospiraceae bacterium]|nr:16S rRNA (guanine(966)-N(2))-methyltransferase RsmD [Oscillospiraceae bacterium]